MEASNIVANTPVPPTAAVTQLSMLQEFAKFMDEGGIFMWVILAIWILGVVIVFERFRKLAQYDIAAKPLMDQIKQHVLLNEVQQAIQLCASSKALLPQVLKNGLKRANQAKDQIQDALEASLLAVIPQLERRLPQLNLIANVSTLLGLLGTIHGLIDSFAAVANADPASKAKLLALGIAKAMNTTALGLVSAISIMVMHSFLSSRSEKIMADLEEGYIQLVDLLNSKRGAGANKVLSEKSANDAGVHEEQKKSA